MVSGFILIDKDKGFTSHDVVAKVRKIFNTKKIGHGGTLDPNATGLLPLAVNKATRALEYVLSDDKEYIALMKLGSETDTGDRWGKILYDTDKRPSEDQIRETFSDFLGRQKQIPPMYSAIKKDGKKLYELARQGIEIEREEREIEIKELEILDIDLSQDIIKFRVLASKGTYIRQLITDMGRSLGSFAHMAELRRTRTGPFELDKAYKLDYLESLSEDGLNSCLIPIDLALSNIESYYLSEDYRKNIINGQEVFVEDGDKDLLNLYIGGEYFGLAFISDGKLRIKKLFLETNS